MEFSAMMARWCDCHPRNYPNSVQTLVVLMIEVTVTTWLTEDLAGFAKQITRPWQSHGTQG
jgi:hypothetical protein